MTHMRDLLVANLGRMPETEQSGSGAEPLMAAGKAE
jgi:hypothetical protein